MLCASPMSLITAAYQGTRLPLAAGTCSPARVIRAHSPAVLSATVLPPALGPEMTSTDRGRRAMSLATQ